MGTSQDLVPTDLPYGSRQQTVAAMQAADVPTSSEGAGGGLSGPTAAPPAATPTPPAPSSSAPLSGFDVFQNREPTEGFQATPQRRVMFERIRQSDNRVMQSIAERMQGYKEG